MRSAISNLLNLSPQNIVTEVYVMLAMVWLMVLIGAIWSIVTSEKSAVSRLFWSAIVIFLPGVGLLLYALFCFTKLDLLFLRSRASSSPKTPARLKSVAKKGDGDYADAVL